MPPTAIVAFSAHVCPKAWNIGRAPSVIVVSSRSKISTAAAMLRIRLAWVSWAPLGLPVVPLV